MFPRTRQKKYYKAGDTLSLALDFTSPVKIAEGSSPKLHLQFDNGVSAAASYVSGSDSTRLLFEYLVPASVNSQKLNANKLTPSLEESIWIIDADGLLDELKLPLLGSGKTLAESSSLVVDTITPSAPSSAHFAGLLSTSSSSNLSWTNGSDLNPAYNETKICRQADCQTSCSSETNTLLNNIDVSLAPNLSYYGCVRSVDLSGNSSAWSSTASSTTYIPQPTFTGAKSGEIVGSFDNGKGKLRLKFWSNSQYVSQYRVYYSNSPLPSSFNFASPIASFNAGDSRYDADAEDDIIDVEIPAQTLNDGYYVVRYYDPNGLYNDTNTSVTTLVNVLVDKPGYVLVPRAYSGLSYDYYIMRYEASLSVAGVNPGSDIVSATESDIASCSYQFHHDSVAAHSSCGTRNITKTTLSQANATPASNISYASSFYACRNSSSADSNVRLPTAEEWERASAWMRGSYASMWAYYSDSAAGHCNVRSGAAALTGTAADCVTGLGINDMAGNLKEWVDHRVVQYSISSQGESRFSYGPTIARNLRNGIDNIQRRYHTFDPGAGGKVLTMGADFKDPTLTDQKQFGADVQTWSDPGSSDDSIGFRCVAFRADQMPSLDQMALTDEPKYSSADLPAAQYNKWRIPENLFVKDNDWENVSITASGLTATNQPDGKVNLSWRPWTKAVATSSGSYQSLSPSIVYDIYRFTEPNRSSARLTIPWALTGSGSAYGSSGNDKPLSPLATDINGARLFSSITSDGRLIGSVSDCSGSQPLLCRFEDSEAADTNFSANLVYNYILVIRDDSGNSVLPKVQRFRSPFFAGPKPSTYASSFRMEPRFRRASVALINEPYQDTLSPTQTMVHVPMDLSGLDHDFFIQKYDTKIFSGSYVNNSPSGSASFPNVHDGSGGWIAKAARCHDYYLRTGVLLPIYCGNGTVNNGTTVILQSKSGVTTGGNDDQGAAWKACRNTTFSDGSGNIYALRLTSGSEYRKAGDWGDLNQDGIIDVSPEPLNILATTASIENGAADTTTVRCHTDNSPTGARPNGSSDTAKCISRYGMRDPVGNSWKFTNDRLYDAVGLDNGIDGLFLGLSHAASGSVGGANSTVDLLRGMIKPTSGGAVNQYYVLAASNNNTIGPSTGERSVITSGDEDASNGNAGRWKSWVSWAPSNTNATYLGPRCVY